MRLLDPTYRTEDSILGTIIKSIPFQFAKEFRSSSSTSTETNGEWKLARLPLFLQLKRKI